MPTTDGHICTVYSRSAPRPPTEAETRTLVLLAGSRTLDTRRARRCTERGDLNLRGVVLRHFNCRQKQYTGVLSQAQRVYVFEAVGRTFRAYGRTESGTTKTCSLRLPLIPTQFAPESEVEQRYRVTLVNAVYIAFAAFCSLYSSGVSSVCSSPTSYACSLSLSAWIVYLLPVVSISIRPTNSGTRDVLSTQSTP